MTRSRKRSSKAIRFRGESLGPERIQEIRRVLREQRGATRYQITKELCRLWNWRLPSGALSLGACRDFLCRLQEHGLIKLPAPRTRPGRRKKVTISES